MAHIVSRVAGAPMSSVASIVDEVGGLEAEFFFEGTARRFALAGSDEYSTDGRWAAEIAGEARFRSRMVVLRPRDPSDFNGTVIVEWNNVSSGEGFLNAYAGADRLLRAGFAVVGVSAQAVGIEAEDLPSLKSFDAERYGSLHHPGDEYSYDIFTQAGDLLGPDRSGDPDPLGELAVRHLVAVGASQSSARLGTYFNALQQDTARYDGFVLVVYPNSPTALAAADAPDVMPQTFGPNIFQLLDWYRYVLRDDLSAPVIVLNSESEASECHPNSQPDTELIRWWEVPGTSHTGVVTPAGMTVEALPVGTDIGFGPALHGAYHSMHRWLDDGVAPPRQPRLLKEGDPPRFARDEHGNATGGIRWPDIVAPVGTHVAEAIEGDGSNLLRGTTTYFSADELATLYPDHGAWVAQYRDAVAALVESGVILDGDAADMVAKAESTPFPE